MLVLDVQIFGLGQLLLTQGGTSANCRTIEGGGVFDLWRGRDGTRSKQYPSTSLPTRQQTSGQCVFC